MTSIPLESGQGEHHKARMDVENESGPAEPRGRRITIPYPSPLGAAVFVDEEEALECARDAFYRALAEAAPSALVDLERTCLPALRETETGRLAFTPPEHWQRLVPIGPAVATWAALWRLDASWLIQDAIGALLDLRNDQIDQSPSRLRLISHGAPSPMDRYPNMQGEVKCSFYWKFDSQPRAVFRNMMLSVLVDQLDAELDRIEAQAESLGWRRIHKSSLDRHMGWLARRVVRLESEVDIAGSDPNPPSTRAVQQAVRDAAELIDLAVPRRKTGKPKRPRPAVVKKVTRR